MPLPSPLRSPHHSSARTLLEARAIQMRFGALQVLDRVDFAVRPGDAIGIVGPNGAGKTTLLNVLAGAYVPTAGSVHFQGQDVSPLGAAERCRLGLARSHQVPKPFNGMTVFENVLAAATHGGGYRQGVACDRAIDALRLCGMLPLANRRADTLGLLDRKRLELVRALATGPTVLLLDEIGGGLTDGEASELVGMVRLVRARGIAIVWIEHLMHVLLQVAEQLVCMAAGSIIAQGEPQAVLANRTVVDAYLGGGV